jgi:hypothetical protein
MEKMNLRYLAIFSERARSIGAKLLRCSFGMVVGFSLFAFSANAEDLVLDTDEEGQVEPEAKVYNVDPVNNPNIVSIINNAEASSTVYVSKGEYKITTSLTPANGVKIIGTTGNYNDVIIDAQNKCRVILANLGGNYISGITIKGGKVSGNNSTRQFASGIYLTGGGVVTNCRITACTSGNYVSGVGLSVNASYAYDVLVDNCTNNAAQKTEASYLTKGFAVSVRGKSIVERCRVVKNISTYGDYGSNYFGGALAIENANEAQYHNTCIVRNSEIAHNVYENFISSNDGIAGIGVSIRGGTIESCTIVSNVVKNAANDNDAAGVVCFHDNNNTVRNCHIEDNYINGKLNNYAIIGSKAAYLKRFVNCCTSPLNANFVSCVLDDKTKWTFDRKGRVQLLKGSPCIDAASQQSWMVGATDLYGIDRKLYGKADIGAVEYVKPMGLSVFVR